MKNLLIAAAIAAATASPSVMAASTATATLSNFNFTLFDLNIDDGLNPSATLFGTNQSDITLAVIKNNLVDPTAGQPFEVVSTSGGGNLETITIGPNTANGRTSNGFFTSPIILEVSGTSLGGSNFDVGYNAAVSDLFSFEIGANTRLVITADAFVDAQVDDLSKENAQSTAGINLFTFSSTLANDAVQINTGNFGESNLTNQVLLSLVFDNVGENQIFANFSSFVQVNGFSKLDIENPNPSAVPVPAALPLMASALGLFGFGAMRRKASKA